MRTIAYCAANFAEQTRRASGVQPLTSPPYLCDSFPISVLENRDFIYFDLHGLSGAPVWLNSDGQIALSENQLQHVNLGGAIVFATCCFLGDERSSMRDALLNAGAGAVIAGSGRNFSPETGNSYGAGLLGMWIRRLLAFGLPSQRAFQASMERVRLAMPVNPMATADTLSFKMFTRPG